jgi:hypothetical protein
MTKAFESILSFLDTYIRHFCRANSELASLDSQTESSLSFLREKSISTFSALALQLSARTAEIATFIVE